MPCNGRRERSADAARERVKRGSKEDNAETMPHAAHGRTNPGNKPVETGREEAGQGHVGQGCTTTATEPVDILTEHDVSCLDNLPTGQHTAGYGQQYPVEGSMSLKPIKPTIAQ